MIDDLAKIPLEFSPGEAWNYSVATDVIGYLVGKISGMPFEQFLKERILDPLGMNDTDFYVPADKAHRFAACYSADPKGGMNFHAADRKGGLTLQDDPTTSSFLSPPSFISGGGGLCSTACRLSHLLPRAAQWRRTRRRPAARAEDAGADDVQSSARRTRSAGDVALAVLARRPITASASVSASAVTMNPAQTLIPGSPGEYSWGGAATTSFWIDPAEELITIFMTQVLPSSAYPLRRELRTMVYAAITDSNL